MRLASALLALLLACGCSAAVGGDYQEDGRSTRKSSRSSKSEREARKKSAKESPSDKGEAASSKSKTGKGAKKSAGKASKNQGVGGDVATAALPPDVPASYKPRKAACEKYRDMIEVIAARHGLEPELVLGVVKVESNFNPECRSRVGATGLMQVMPRTGDHMECDDDLEDPQANVECGCRVLKKYLGLYNGNVVYGLAAYNAGPGNANPSAKESKTPFNFGYVEKVLRWRNVFVRYGCR